MTNQNIRRALLSIVPFLIVLLFYLFFRESVQQFDLQITHFVVNQRNTVTDIYFHFVTILANAEFLAIVVIAAILMIGFLFKQWKLALAYGLAVILGNLVLNPVLKEIFQRSRPDEALRMVAEASYSFPSGHSFATGMIYPLFADFLLRSTNLSKHSTLIQFILILVMVSIGLSRIYLGVHYFTDVIAGFSLGFSFYCLTRFVLEKYTEA